MATDGAVEGVITVAPEGGGEQRRIPLDEWRHNYVFQGEDYGGMKVNRELTAAARRGFDDRVAGRPAGPRPAGAKESDQVDIGREKPTAAKGGEDEDPDLPGTQATRPPQTLTEAPAEAQPPTAATRPGRPATRPTPPQRGQG